MARQCEALLTPSADRVCSCSWLADEMPEMVLLSSSVLR